MRHTPCIVVGNQLNGLGVARSLAADGIPVIVAATGGGPAWRSHRFVRAPLSAMAGEPLVAELLALAGRLGGGPLPLLLTDEMAMLTVSACRDRLAQAYSFALPTHAVVLDLLEKSRFQELATARNYPIPTAVTVRGPADLALLEGLRFPCAVKPSCRTPAYEAAFKKAYVIGHRDEAADLAKKMLEVVSEVMVQEWIEGADSDIYFCLFHMAEGRADTVFVGRKLRINPPRFGSTASCIDAPEARDELAALTHRFFSELDYQGLGSMEYKRDRRDGRFYMVEPTVGRTDWQEEVATLNGINLPAAAYRALTGLPPLPPATVSPPRVWCNLWEHMASGLHDPLPAAPLPRGAVVKDALWRYDDPLPALLGYPRLLVRKALRLGRQVLGRWTNAQLPGQINENIIRTKTGFS